MPHTSSAKKRLRQTEKRRARNRAVLKGIKKHIKQVEDAASGGAADKMQAELLAAFKKLDKAGSRRVLHPNTVARRKSRLARLKAKSPAPAAK